MQLEIIHQTAGILQMQYETLHNVQYMHHQYSRTRPAFWSAQPADQSLHRFFKFVHVFVDGSSNVEWIVPSRLEQDVCVKISQPIPFSQIPLPCRVSVSCSWHMADHEWQSTKFEPIQLETYELTKLDKHTHKNHIKLYFVYNQYLTAISFLSLWSIISNV